MCCHQVVILVIKSVSTTALILISTSRLFFFMSCHPNIQNTLSYLLAAYIKAHYGNSCAIYIKQALIIFFTLTVLPGP